MNYINNKELHFEIGLYQQSKTKFINKYLIESFDKIFYGIIYKVLKRVNDSNILDIKQDAFIDYMYALDKFDMNKFNAFAYFTEIIKNGIIRGNREILYFRGFNRIDMTFQTELNNTDNLKYHIQSNINKYSSTEFDDVLIE